MYIKIYTHLSLAGVLTLASNSKLCPSLDRCACTGGQAKFDCSSMQAWMKSTPAPNPSTHVLGLPFTLPRHPYSQLHDRKSNHDYINFTLLSSLPRPGKDVQHTAPSTRRMRTHQRLWAAAVGSYVRALQLLFCRSADQYNMHDQHENLLDEYLEVNNHAN